MGGYEIFGDAFWSTISITIDAKEQSFWSMRTLLSLYKIDDWNNNNFLITITNSENYSQEITIYSSIFGVDSIGNNLCGLPDQIDQIIDIDSNKTSENFTIFILKLSSQKSNGNGLDYWGFRNLSIIIDSCHSSCKKCKGPSNTQCTLCDSSTNLYYTGECLICFPTCATCDGTYYNNCSSCIENLNLLNNQCLCIDEGKYPDSLGNCNGFCESSCQTCYGPLNSHCLSCNVNESTYYDNLTTQCLPCDI